MPALHVLTAIIIVFVAGFPFASRALTVRMVKDINRSTTSPTTASSDAKRFVMLGDRVVFSADDVLPDDLTVQAILVSEEDRHLFGLNQKTTRLPGHGFYFKK